MNRTTKAAGVSRRAFLAGAALTAAASTPSLLLAQGGPLIGK